MVYREFSPPTPLRELVECGWTNEFAGRPVASSVDILPDGCMDLVWTGAELLVAGPDTAPHPVSPAGGAGGGRAALRARPAAGPAGVPAAALRDLRVPLLELHPRPARSAAARLERGASPARVLVELAGQLPGPAPDPGVAVVVGHARRRRSVGETADALGWTTRSLHRHCQDWFGYGPSVLRRVLRFRDAVALLRAGIAPADVAARVGYADQPHLSREMRGLAGRAPRQLTTGGS